MPKYRLHELEGAIEIFSTEPFVLRPAELYKVEGDLRKELERYNLYIVARRPRMGLLPSSLTLSAKGDRITGLVEAQVGDLRKPIPFKTSLRADLQATRLAEHEYPFDYLRFDTISGLPAQISLHEAIRFSDVPHSPLTDMQVEYVGQAFGEAGERDVVDRLIGNTGKVGHGALQKVLAEVNAEHPDQEVHLLLYSFEFHKRYIIGGGLVGQPEPQKAFNEAPNRFEQFFESEIKRYVRIDLADAALIRYFRPTYNDKYKRSFPAETHQILKRLLELDVTGLAVSVSTQDHNIRLVSNHVQPSDSHFVWYPILTDTDRQSFFDIAMPSLKEK